MFILAVSIWQRLEEWDRWLFTRINRAGANPFFDQLMPFIREAIVWAPLYLFILVLVLTNFRKQAGWWILFFISTVAMTDLVGNYVFKHGIKRIRPCNDPLFADQVRLLLDHCGAGFSFTSNHAANHFGMAVFFFLTLRRSLGKWVWTALLWAAMIAYAQVYVGVHYPFDVLGGAILGMLFGITTGTLFNKRFGFVIFENQPTYP